MFDIHIYKYSKNFIHFLTSKLDTLMATLEDLQVKLAELQETVDAEQVQIAELLAGQQTTIEGLEAQIAELQGMVASAPTPEQLQAVVDGLEAIKTDLSGTV